MTCENKDDDDELMLMLMMMMMIIIIITRKHSESSNLYCGFSCLFLAVYRNCNSK